MKIGDQNARDTHMWVDDASNTAVEANHDEQRHKDGEWEEDGNVMYTVQNLIPAHLAVVV